MADGRILMMDLSVLEKVDARSEYIATLKDCDVKVGGVNPSDFVPSINMSRWNDECWLNVKSTNLGIGEKEVFDGKCVSLQLRNERHRYYVDKSNNLEYEIVLQSRPVSNQIELELAFSKGLEFCPQPPVSTNDVRVPEDVRDSYAVYCKHSNNRYKSGKFCHLYRIAAMDQLGHSRWCKQEIKDSLWTIILPQDFLDTATYPITVDPVLGYDTIGASTQRVYNSMKMGSSFMSPAVAGVATLFHAAISAVGSPPNQKFAIYDTDQATENPGGKPLIDGVEMTNPSVSDDNQVAAQGGAIAASTKYWIGTICQSGNNYVKCDFIGNPWIGSGTTYAAEWTAMFGPGTDWGGFCFSIWVDYEAAGGISHPILSGEGIHSIQDLIVR